MVTAGTCYCCRQSTLDAVVVGFIEVGSGAAPSIYACSACVRAYRLLPLDEHPPGTDGRPRYAPRPIRRGHGFHLRVVR